MESDKNIPSTHCYCECNTFDSNMLICKMCNKRFHPSCLKTGRPSELVGDIYFKLECANCNPDGNETVQRLKLQWNTVISLTLYNLRLQGGGKYGYFRWREHICRFIDKHWILFFGSHKRKSATWHGTISGSLYNGGNRYFTSGIEVLGESGWWTLKSTKLPPLEQVETANMNGNRVNRIPRKRKVEETSNIVEGSRKRNSNVLEAALSLKEKKASISPGVKAKVKSKRKSKSKIVFSPNHKLKLIVPQTEPFDSCLGEPRAIPKIIIKTERSVSPSFSNNATSHWIKEEPSDDLDFKMQDLPSNIFDFPTSLDNTDSFNSLLDDVLSEINCNKTVKSSPKYESDDENSNSSKPVQCLKKVQHLDTGRKKKAITKDENPVKETVISEPKYTMMLPYDEEQLLSKLKNYPITMREKPDVRCLYRKLIVRKLKREKHLPLFDIDAEVRSIRGMDPPDYFVRSGMQQKTNDTTSAVLDRYQTFYRTTRGKHHSHISFITRLMGLEDEQHDCIISPYTERTLKPFIFRDYTTKPLKLKMLEELVIKVNKPNPEFVAPMSYPIDYCYVRPQHIPAVNALCQEFFWPGIDLSECLQYPDFSCIALYRKIIIGFAFMVPDVKYNEAYISFIFCHPEWRRAGIATFMLYHLIQTCMGKDITLHVSATSAAVFLYQKFGFKVEEFIHDFYDKYLPPDSKECRHALFLRLNR